jgi:hypothetical protein
VTEQLIDSFEDEDEEMIRQTIRELERALARDWRELKELIDQDTYSMEDAYETLEKLSVADVRRRG